MRRFLGLFLVVSTMVSVLAAVPAAAGVSIGEFGTPSANSGPEGIALGSDGNIWYTECKLGNIGVMTPSKPPSFGTEYSVGGCPNSITAGPDKNLWFTDNFNIVPGSFGTYQYSEIGQMTTSGAVTMFPFPVVPVRSGFTSQGVEVNSITTGPDNNLWFTAYQEAYELNPTMSWTYQMIGRITPSGTITTFVIPDAHFTEGGSVGAFSITAGPDNNLWFTQGDGLGQVTTGGTFTLFPGDFGYGITAWDGELWTTAETSIGRYSTSGSGGTIPLSASDYASGGLAPEDCSNNLWFTGGNTGTDTVGAVNNVFAVTPYKTPTKNSTPYAITAGGTAPTGSPRRMPARSVGSSTRSPPSPVCRTSRARSS